MLSGMVFVNMCVVVCNGLEFAQCNPSTILLIFFNILYREAGMP